MIIDDKPLSEYLDKFLEGEFVTLKTIYPNLHSSANKSNI
jgi:hypothetical protein